MNEFEQIHLLDQFNGLKHEIALADGLMSMLAAGGYDVRGLRKDQYRVSVDVSQVMSATAKTHKHCCQEECICGENSHYIDKMRAEWPVPFRSLNVFE